MATPKPLLLDNFSMKDLDNEIVANQQHIQFEEEVKKEEEAVLISKNSNKIHVYRLQDGMSQAEAEQAAKENGATSIDKTTFGYLDGQPVWEIKSGSTYYNIGFESKTLLSKEGL